ncbi:uncharacterized protein At4g00950-like [Neltuma alba]|uniref:uncharacterized protein At4g00950 n=1 Tax=Neltuma alba TaxID=207710 RepID=UPI0010A51829|nr:uncharacterized protein At4g00950-like [Prosopis alba]XP_028806703.1 uncharacterized protein At4g00950-like [Prosopis alba]
MGSEPDYDHQIYSPSKLSMLISRPIKPPEAAPLPSPPTAVSIPFRWEEAPGKPRPCHTRSEPDSCGRRALELPPRLVFPESKASNVHSPTTVLDGPYVGRAVSFTTSYRSPRMVGKDQWNGNFGSSRWSSSGKNRRQEYGASIDFSNGLTFWDDGGFESNTTVKAKIAKIGRRGSLFNLSQSRSHLWASIYESLKQVVPWKRKQEKQRKWDLRRN